MNLEVLVLVGGLWLCQHLAILRMCQAFLLSPGFSKCVS